MWETMYSGFHLQMVLFKQTLEEGSNGKTIIVTRVGPENPSPEQLEWTGSEHQIRVPLRPGVNDLEKVHVDLHGSATNAYDMGKEIQEYFSKYMGFETHLLYIGTNSRVVLGSGAPNGTMAQAKRSPYTAPLRKLLPSSLAPQPETITFQDIGQYLVVTKESNDEVGSRLAEGKMDISKFRPNIIVSGSPVPYDEDYWAQVVLPGDIKMEFGGTCWRCQAITVDYKTGRKAEGDEGMVWKKLAADRRVDKGWKYGPVFGKYSYTAKKDYGKEIRAGDEIVLTKRVKERPVFGESSDHHRLEPLLICCLQIGRSRKQLFPCSKSDRSHDKLCDVTFRKAIQPCRRACKARERNYVVIASRWTSGCAEKPKGLNRLNIVYPSILMLSQLDIYSFMLSGIGVFTALSSAFGTSTWIVTPF
jgi:uncharacterized protein YcbX